MKLTHKDYSGACPKADLLVCFGLQGKKVALPGGVAVPKAAQDDFGGDARETRITDATSGDARRVLFVGLGEQKSVTLESFRRAAGIAVQQAEGGGCKNAIVYVDAAIANLAGGPDNVGCAVSEALVMGHYRYDLGKSKPEPFKLARVQTLASGAEFKRGAKRGAALGDANCFTRDLQNRAGNQLTPTAIASEARGLARRSDRITCKVLDEAGMKKLGMGLLLGVSAGSREPAKLVHLVYKPKGKSKGKVALVGKGLTFDAGGISLKPSRGMEDMRYDMSGSAAVLGAFHALASVDVDFEVHGIVPSSENMPDGMATKPGDIHVGMNGTTVEVVNTDAEGRLILADALTYTVTKVKPETIIDLATLTGAVVVGLGHEITGMFASTDALRDDLSAAGEECAERVWPLPLLPDFLENMKGGPSDVRNITTPEMGGGSIAGAAFLSHFVGDTEWAHLDIAGTAWNQKARDYVGGKGGTGVGTRLLIQYLCRRN